MLRNALRGLFQRERSPIIRAVFALEKSFEENFFGNAECAPDTCFIGLNACQDLTVEFEKNFLSVAKTESATGSMQLHKVKLKRHRGPTGIDHFKHDLRLFTRLHTGRMIRV